MEREFWGGFNRERGRLLGVMFDVISGALSHRKPLASKPRMADWAEIASAIYEYAGWGREQFVADWEHAEETQNSNAVEGSLVGSTILDYMGYQKRFVGTAQELLDSLLEFEPDLKFNRFFPKTPNRLSKEINKVADTLCSMGVHISRTTIGKGKVARRGIRLEQSADTEGRSADSLPIDSGVSADQETRSTIPNAADDVPRSADTVDTFPTSKVERIERVEEGDGTRRGDKPENQVSADLSADLSADPDDWGLYEVLCHMYDVDAAFYGRVSDRQLWAHLVECKFISVGTDLATVRETRERVRAAA